MRQDQQVQQDQRQPQRLAGLPPQRQIRAVQQAVLEHADFTGPANSPDATGPAVTPEVSGPTTTGPDSSGSAGSAGARRLPPGERGN